MVTTLAPDLHIQSCFLQETFRAIRVLKTSLEQVKQEPAQRQHIVRIKRTAESIRDLAMIHGFDGVEKISAKIASTFANILRTSTDLDQHFLNLVESAVLAIQQVAEVEETLEKQMTIERISRDVEIRQQKVQDCTTRVTRELDYFSNKQIELIFDEKSSLNLPPLTQVVNTVAETPPVIFDIREYDSVLCLAEKTEDLPKTLDLFDEATQVDNNHSE